MAGKIIADTIETGAGADISTSYVVNGSAKAWAFFDGTGTPSLDGSFNTASLSDLGTGSYLLTWSNALSDANYSSTASGRSFILTGSAAVQTTTTVRIGLTDSAGNAVDDTNNSVTAHGDLA